MTQAERDRLVILRKVRDKRMTQAEAAQELEVSVRQVKRLVKALKKRGDAVVIHGLKGKPSNHRAETKLQKKAVQILSRDEYRGFGPTLASEHLSKRHGLEVSRETTRKWMTEAGLWVAKKERLQPVHLWRPRRSQCGELVQWDTCEHDWLEGRSPEKLYLIAMIDDATSRLFARFVPSDSTAENMRVLWRYLELYGRPQAVYTDKAALFQTAQRRRRDQPGVDLDPVERAPTQIGRALQELGIVWIPAHSPQAKGRVERCFETAQDRLVKELRVANVCSGRDANLYLDEHYLPWWGKELTVEAAQPRDAHRPLTAGDNLAAILSHVEARQVRPDYTFPLDGELYRILRQDVTVGLRGAKVRVEQRLDGTVAARFQDRYLTIEICDQAAAAETPPPADRRPPPRPHAPNRGGKSQWMKRFRLHGGPSLEEAIEIANSSS